MLVFVCIDFVGLCEVGIEYCFYFVGECVVDGYDYDFEIEVE